MPYLVGGVVVVVDKGVAHLVAGREVFCPRLNLGLDVLVVGDDKPCRRHVSGGGTRQRNHQSALRIKSLKRSSGTESNFLLKTTKIQAA